MDGDTTIFRFEDFALDTGAAELTRNGVLVPVEPQVFDLLTLLVAQHDRIVTRDDIIADVWQGRIVSDSAIASRINAARKALADDGTAQRLIRTVHGRGFRFAVTPVTTAPASDAPTASETPSIAVLPFEVMSDSDESRWFADGIAEDILNDLSRFHELTVIARNSSFAFRGQTLSAREVAEKLSVKYLLLGSVRQVGQRIRVSVQLIDATQDRALWSDRYDGDLTDIFGVQDDIAARAVSAIAPQTEYHEKSSASRKALTDLSEWERIMRARWHMDRHLREDTDTAMSILTDVIERSPEIALAHSSVAYCHFHRMLNAWCENTLDEIAAAEDAARRAVCLDAYDASALALLGLAAMFGHRWTECFDWLAESTAKNPNNAAAHGFRSVAHGCRGELEPCRAAYDTALRLSPTDASRTMWMSGLAVCLLVNRRYDEVLDLNEQMLRIMPGYGPALRQRTSALAHLGRMDEAKASLEELLQHMPGLTVIKISRMIPISGPENREHWLDGLRLAGMPEE